MRCARQLLPVVEAPAPWLHLPIEYVLLEKRAASSDLQELPKEATQDQPLVEPTRIGPPAARRAESRQKPIRAQQAR